MAQSDRLVRDSRAMIAHTRHLLTETGDAIAASWAGIGQDHDKAIVETIRLHRRATT